MQAYYVSAAIVLASAVAPTLAIPPPSFGFPDSDNHTELSVAYTFNGNTTIVQEGQLFGANITSSVPALAVDPAQYQSIADYNGQYVVLMVDPDAPSPDNPARRFILHWLATDVTQTSEAQAPQTGRALTNSTPAQVPYRGPMPPTNSSAHRYIFYAFAQPDNFAIPESFRSFNNENRANFNLDDFMRDANLNRPLAGEFLYASRQESVPGDFIALPGGEYPGGNGNAIFEGMGTSPSPSPTESSGAAPSTSDTGNGGEGGTNPESGAGSANTGSDGTATSTMDNAAALIAPTTKSGVLLALAAGLLGAVALL